MDFGMGSYEGLEMDNFTFQTAANFYFPTKPVKQNVYIGLPKWSDIKYMVPGTKEKDSLKEYTKHFDSIELNATHYKIYDEVGIDKWLGTITSDQPFLFCPKMYKGITHYGSLINKEAKLQEFFKSIRNLKNHLGPVFIQLNNFFSPARKEELITFLDSLPKSDFKFFLELRHDEWLKTEIINDLSAKLHRLGIGLIITDTPLLRSHLHMNFPVTAAFIRFVCDGNTEIDFYRITEWKKQLQYLASQGVENVYFFLHIHNQQYTGDFYNFVKGQLC